MPIKKKSPFQTVKSNPSRPSRKSTARRASASVRSGAARTARKASPKRNPAPATTRRVVKRPRTSGSMFKPNGAVANVIMGAIGGALILGATDVVFSRLPSFSAPVKMAITGGAAFAVHSFGKKLPIIGAYAPAVAGALALLTAYIGVQNYVVPYVTNLLGGGTPAVVQEQVIKDDATGQLGMRLYTDDGNYLDTFVPQAASRAQQLMAAY